ncbi:hypothetical protein FisN_1Lh372 [Fistulifera solaris]|uniref:PPIase cyclophilin-type domain-containing protein n=1 Tax=Fistulifera solaris TaxID=1519565 RepID=A0A1Z5K3Z3_FISSO|nr:hypothetical protein FisN_1Lh372 [Fistulifera solaris]|eukprot:GAX20964.1 hypothetical protein FisN_1Lh372 [Fistulifera solaris]
MDLSSVAAGNCEEDIYQNHTPTCQKNLALLLLISSVLLGGTFYFGIMFGQHASRKIQEDNVAENSLRDELLLSQEKLLVELAKSQSQSIQNAMTNGENSENKDSTMSTDSDVTNEPEKMSLMGQHLELLQKELAQQALALSEERKLLDQAAEEVKQAWGSYQLYTSQIEAERRAIDRDLQVLFEKLTVEEFGPGPHFIQFQLYLPRLTDEVDDMFSYFTIEITSEKVAPTSVFFFLKQIDLGLWSGPTIYFNDGRTLSTDLTQTVSAGALTTALAAKLMNTNNSLAKKLTSNAKQSSIPIDKMISHGFGHLPFPEDSANALPQSKYTVCFKPNDRSKHRPGPAIYINQADNDGPPSCFGTVIIGREVIDRIGEMKGPPHDPNYLKKPIRIISAILLDKLADAVGADKYIAQEHKNFKEEM